jgi:hypothetical protein
MWTLVLALNAIHLAYHQTTTLFDFYPFNNVRHYKTHERVLEAGLNGLMMALPIVALALHSQRMIGIACWVLGFLVVGEFLSWWPHYFWDTSKSLGKWGAKWKEVYARTHRHTITFLPPIKDHPIPNLEHCILHVMTMATFVVTLTYYLNS